MRAVIFLEGGRGAKGHPSVGTDLETVNRSSARNQFGGRFYYLRCQFLAKLLQHPDKSYPCVLINGGEGRGGDDGGIS